MPEGDDREAEMHEELMKFLGLMEAGSEDVFTWTNLTYHRPPEDLLGRIFWSFGVLAQLVISWLTFPAAIGSFLMEESVQSFGMGAYMLASSKYYDLLDEYLLRYEKFIDAATAGAKTLAYVNPIAGGAVLVYMKAAEASCTAFKQMTEKKLLEQAEQDEKLRQKLLYEATHGTLYLRSSPSGAEIWMNGENTEKLTPETFKGLPEGDYTIELRKYSTKRETWDIYAFTTHITPGKKKEIYIHIPPTIEGEGEIEPTPGTARLTIKSIPSDAEIYINDENTGVLTPETFKNLDAGLYKIKLRSYSRRRNEWDEYEFTIELEPNQKKELRINIPEKTTEETEDKTGEEETETPQLPEFIKAVVTGSYAIDGDTFVTTNGEHIRILGIDAPELGTPYSEEAKNMLDEMIRDKKVYLKIQTSVPIDEYGRTLAICTTSRGTLGVLLLVEGLARAFIAEDATYDPTPYTTAEKVAKERKVGIWSQLP